MTTTAQHTTLTGSKVWEHIAHLLRQTASRDARGVHVEVREGHVVLSGHVHSLDARDQVECAAWSMPGVTDVQNDLVTSV